MSLRRDSFSKMLKRRVSKTDKSVLVRKRRLKSKKIISGFQTDLM